MIPSFDYVGSVNCIYPLGLLFVCQAVVIMSDAGLCFIFVPSCMCDMDRTILTLFRLCWRTFAFWDLRALTWEEIVREYEN